MSLSIFSRKSGGSNKPVSHVQSCVAKLKNMPDESIANFVKNEAKATGKNPTDFARDCLATLKDTPGDNALKDKLRHLTKEPASLPSSMAERATLPSPPNTNLRQALNISSYDPSLQSSDAMSAEKPVAGNALSAPSMVDRKAYDTTVFKRSQSERVVKHALAHPDEAKALFVKYSNSGKSGPESRLNKLHDEITKIQDPERRDAMLSDFVAVLADRAQLVGHALTHLDMAEALFTTHVAGASRPEASLQALAGDIRQLHYIAADKLGVVLDRVLVGMATNKGSEVAEGLLTIGGFNADFAQVSAENKLSNQEGLKQLSADFDRGVLFEEGISLSTLSEDAKAFVGRFANQQSAAALVTSGALNIGEKVNDLLEGSGFRLDGWNSDHAGVSYNVSVSKSGAVSLSIPTTIAIKPTVMSSVESLPICIATLEMSMTPLASGGYAYAVSVAFSPLS